MLELNELSVRLGPNQFTFSLSAKTEKVSAILGKSGSGKSTLLNLIAGFLKIESGTITWNGESLKGLPANKRPVTTLFQQHNLFTHLTVSQNIGLGINTNLRLSRQDHEDIKRVLAEVDLDGFSGKSCNTLSGGEQQRVALARCLLRNQPILLLDEPFSALDEDTRHDMITLTRKVITDRNLCVVLVTHNRQDAHMLNASMHELQDGRLTATE